MPISVKHLDRMSDKLGIDLWTIYLGPREAIEYSCFYQKNCLTN